MTTLTFRVRGMDFSNAGEVGAKVKRILHQIGFEREVTRRAAVAAYEMELNIVIHAYEGEVKVRIFDTGVEIIAEDRGPGIPDIELAMQEGYSTAPPEVWKMGFGAGMGLPNIRKCSDIFEISSEVGKGTYVRSVVLRG